MRQGLRTLTLASKIKFSGVKNDFLGDKIFFMTQLDLVEGPKGPDVVPEDHHLGPKGPKTLEELEVGAPTF